MKNAYQLKRVAIDGLTGHWGIAIGAGLVATALMGGASYGASFGSGASTGANTGTEILGAKLSMSMILTALAVIAVIFVSAFAISIAYSLFSSVIETGYARFNIDLVDGNTPMFGSLFSYFRYWKNVAVAGILRTLFTLLGFMLFIVPGIIISYNYAMTPYVLAEDPTISGKQALAISKKMMHGNRWRLFCLEISFIGWAFLCVLSLGVGTIWLVPYQNAARAAFYRDLASEQSVYTASIEE